MPDYELQHERLLAYFTTERVLHTYGKFSLSGTMQSSPNTKSLQPVQSVEGAVDKLARSRAAPATRKNKRVSPRVCLRLSLSLSPWRACAPSRYRDASSRE